MKVKLVNVCEKIGSGATPRGGDASYISHGISLVRSQNVLDFIFSKDGLAHITDAQAKELSNVELKERDVLVNITGDSVARVCQISKQFLPARVNQHVAILRADKSKLNPEYLKYCLLQPSSKESLLTYASSGATRKALTKGILEGFEIQLPDLPTQTRIASILSALDDKIELNRQMNHTLELMAQVLFKKYFVNDIDKDNLPVKWRMGKYSEIVDITTGKGLKREEFVENGNYPVHGANGIIGYTTNFLYNEKLILTGRVGTLGTVHLVNGKIWISDNVLISKPKSEFHLYQANFILQSFDYKALNRGSTQPLLTQTDLKEQKIILAPQEVIEEFHRNVCILFDKIDSNILQNNTLTNLRDTLLPKLMSGEVSVGQTATVA